MSRYTFKQLENDINATNIEMAASGSNIFFAISRALRSIPNCGKALLPTLA